VRLLSARRCAMCTWLFSLPCPSYACTHVRMHAHTLTPSDTPSDTRACDAGFFDEDRNGEISMAELVSGLKRLGIPLSTWHVRALSRLLPDSAVLSLSLFLQVCGASGCVRRCRAMPDVPSQRRRKRHARRHACAQQGRRSCKQHSARPPALAARAHTRGPPDTRRAGSC